MWYTKSLLAPSMFQCLFALLIAVAWAQDRNPIKLRTHSLEVPYLDSPMRSRWFDFGGDTVVRADKYIRLTHDRPSQRGLLSGRVPLTVTDWEIELEFKITGKGHLNGDGLAIWLTKSKVTQGPVFGGADKFEGLGVFIDTYKNNRPGTVFPYVMAMIGDGNTPYSSHNDGKDNEIGGCSAHGIRNAQVSTKARLTYKQQNLSLDLHYKSQDEWTSCFSVPGVKLPTVAYLGFSAETGELSDNHDIISIETNNIFQGGPRSGTTPPNQNSYTAKTYKTSSSDKSSGSWSWFFLKIVLFLIVCAGGYVGFTAYRSSQRQRF